MAGALIFDIPIMIQGHCENLQKHLRGSPRVYFSCLQFTEVHFYHNLLPSSFIIYAC